MDVTVVIPAYNAERTLAATIQSALDQTRGARVVVVDDGSTDGTAEVARAFGPEVQLIRQPNAGVATARNAGLAAARGEFVAFLDADDTWHPRKLELQVKELRARPDCGLCACGVERVDEEGRLIALQSMAEYVDATAALLLYSSIVPSSASSALCRSNLVADLGGFDVRFSQCADWDFLLRMSRRTRFTSVAAPLVRYFVHSANMSRNIELLERDTMAVLDAFYAEPESARWHGLRRRAYSNQWMIISGSYLHAGDHSAAVRCLGHALRAWPGNAPRALAMPLRRARGISGRPQPRR